MSLEELADQSCCGSLHDDPAAEVEALRARVRELEAQQDVHARVEAELRNTEARYRSLFDEAGVSIWELDWSAAKSKVDSLCESGVKDLRGYLEARPDVVEELIQGIDVIDFNKATIDVYRAPDRETLWQNLDKFSDNTSWDDLPFAIEALASGCSRHVMECREVALDGKEIFIRIVRWVPEGYQDTWGRVIEVIEDITDRKRAEDLSVRLGRIVEASLDEVYVFDKQDLHFVQVNQGARRNLGYSIDELHRLTPLDITPCVTKEEFDELLAPLRSGEKDQTVFSAAHRRKDGSRYDAEVRLQLSRADTPPVFVAMVQDVTERNRAQDAQRKTLSHLDRAQKIAKLGHWEWRLGSKQLSPSQGMAEIFDISTDELRISDQDYLSFVHPEDREQVEAAFGGPDEVDQAYETEYRIIRQDGEERVLFEIGEPAFDVAGKPIGMFGTVQDITERKQVEIELLSAQRRADAANEAKSTFLANMSHEIRTPLNGILGMAQVLSSGQLNEQQCEQVAAVLDSGKSLLAIVNDVLDLSKIEAGRMEIAPSEGDLAHVMRGMRRLWSPLAAEKNLDLIIDVDESVPHLSIFDTLRVRQCISNLLSNAIKFTEAGKVRVHVSAETVENDRQLATIRVVDTGIGMSHDALENVFVPFAQAERSTSRDFGGTGLGLSISRKLAQLMGGDLVVQSQLGEGSVFSLTFGMDPVQHNVDKHIGRARDKGTDAQSSVDCAQLKVLIVDDRPMNLMVARLFLEPYRIEATEAGGGQAALDLLGTNPFDLVLLDMHMPGMDGPETFRRIRASGESWSDVPVVALTADAMSGDRENYLALGMNGYVSKPVDQMELIGEINRVSSAKANKSPKNRLQMEMDDVRGELQKRAGSQEAIAEGEALELLEQDGTSGSQMSRVQAAMEQDLDIPARPPTDGFDARRFEDLNRAWLETAEAELAALLRVIEQLESGSVEPEDGIAQICGLAHDLKGQAGVFGFDLLSQIASSLYMFICSEGRGDGPPQTSVMRAHQVALDYVFNRRLEGDGGDAGATVIAKLDELTGRQSTSPLE